MGAFDSVLIVGARGMLAGALATELSSRSIRFVGVDLPECDITKEEQVRELFARVRPTVVFNCAAFTKVDLCEQQEELATAVNGMAVGILASAAKDAGAKLVHVSTDFVFDGSSNQPYRVEDEPRPVSAYGRSKLAGERLLREINPPGWIIARTAWLYGRGGPSFVRTIVEKAQRGEALKVVDDQVGSPTHTVDLARGLVDLVAANAAGIFHVTNTGQTSWRGLAQAAVDEFGIATQVAPLTTAEYFRMRPTSAKRPAFSVLDTSAFTAAVGRAMPDWRSGLKQFRAAVATGGW